MFWCIEGFFLVVFMFWSMIWDKRLVVFVILGLVGSFLLVVVLFKSVVVSFSKFFRWVLWVKGFC